MGVPMKKILSMSGVQGTRAGALKPTSGPKALITPKARALMKRVRTEGAKVAARAHSIRFG